MVEQARTVRPRGRPNDNSIDRALIEAALEEFMERGYQAMSMESIAARAGVSKVSLYRRWNSKLAVVTDLLRSMSKTTSLEDHGSLEADVRALLNQFIGSSTAKSSAKIVMRMMGEISMSPELLALYRTNLLTPRMEQLRGLVERARTRKELRANLSIDIACSMIAGPLFLYYLTILAETKVDMSHNPAGQLTRAILKGITS